MARRRAKPKRRRSKPKLSILNIAESAAYGSVMTELAFNNNIIEFFTGGVATGGGISLKELVSQPARIGEVAGNITNVDKVIESMIQFALIGVTFKFFNAVTRTPRRKVNASIKMLGLPVRI